MTGFAWRETARSRDRLRNAKSCDEESQEASRGAEKPGTWELKAAGNEKCRRGRAWGRSVRRGHAVKLAAAAVRANPESGRAALWPCRTPSGLEETPGRKRNAAGLFSTQTHPPSFVDVRPAFSPGDGVKDEMNPPRSISGIGVGRGRTQKERKRTDRNNRRKNYRPGSGPEWAKAFTDR